MYRVPAHGEPEEYLNRVANTKIEESMKNILEEFDSLSGNEQKQIRKALERALAKTSA